mmetsp:Transcript_7057/g.14170  ORF Transcript_7057/g.14170 Transcript_7057/m.14170 type:complete len:753 (-) Transcript_7057:295-2553(-)|eukprot:CAMPEP_0171489188 /NCGR_PEP_ID=MMETSP0958-20121227/2617_1 /TAXON_ID=87120 /ORGANISM="Aurantiochytrium limacinum, Strain ATCCMYA-1381" /LENGTH=752 /DNA_ID=CAMNT_0012022371 /DNA_START=78 /DNA_END=2336 /DNA_ORIENTATION=+
MGDGGMMARMLAARGSGGDDSGAPGGALWTEAEYNMTGLGSRNANVRKTSAQDLSVFLSDASRSQEFLYYEGMKFVPKLTEGVSKALAHSRTQGFYDEAAVAACLAVAKVYSHEDEWDGLLEMNINLDPLVPTPQCLLEIARCAAGSSADRVDGLDDIFDEEDEGLENGRKSTRSKKSTTTAKKRKPDAVVTDPSVLQGLSGQRSERSFTSTWSRGLGAGDAALMALVKLSKLHKIYLKTRRTNKDGGRLASQADVYLRLVRVVREALMDTLRKTTSPPVMEANGAVASAASPLLAWRLESWGSVADTYSSVMVMTGGFEAKNYDVFMEQLMRACRGLLRAVIASQTADLPPWGEHALQPLLRFATNLTHDNPAGCEAMNGEGLQLAVDMFKSVAELGTSGSTEPAKKDKSKSQAADAILLGMDLNMEEHEPDAHAQYMFDTRLTLIGLLTNCVETNSQNRVWLSEHCEVFVTFFVAFVPREALEQLQPGTKPQGQVEFGWSAEDLITCSYVCLLLGCLMRENKANQRHIKQLLPGGSLSIVMQVLEAFVAFQKDARVLSKEGETKTFEIMAELRAAELAEVSSMSSTSAQGKKRTSIMAEPRVRETGDKKSSSSSGTARVKIEDAKTSQQEGEGQQTKQRRKVTIVEDVKPGLAMRKKTKAAARVPKSTTSSTSSSLTGDRVNVKTETIRTVTTTTTIKPSSKVDAASSSRGTSKQRTKRSSSTSSGAKKASESSNASSKKAVFSLDDVMG